MRSSILTPVLLAVVSCNALADVEILSSSRSVSGLAYLNIFEESDTDSQMFATMNTGLFDATVDVIADPFPTNYLSTLVHQDSVVSPTLISGETSWDLVWHGVSSGLATGRVESSSYLVVTFQVDESTPFEFTGSIFEPGTISLEGPGTGIYVFLDGSPVTTSGVLDPGVYTLTAEWAIEYFFGSDSGSGELVKTPWSFDLRIPSPGAPAVLALVGVGVCGRRRR